MITAVLTADPAAIAQSASSINRAGGPSPIWDALAAAADAFQRQQGPRAIVLVTDGRATGNRIGFDQIAARLEREQIAVTVIALDLTRQPGPDPLARLRLLSSRTSGGFFFVKREGVPAAIQQACSQLNTRLRMPTE